MAQPYQPVPSGNLRHVKPEWRSGRLARAHEQERRQRGEAERAGNVQGAGPVMFDQEAEGKRRAGLADACRRAQQAEAVAVILRAEHRERHGAAGNGENAVTAAMQEREAIRELGPQQEQHDDAERMPGGRETRRHQRMEPAEEPRFQQPRRDLRRADHRPRGDGLRRGGARRFEQSRQVHRHRRRDDPGGSEGEAQQPHVAVHGDMRFRMLGAVGRGWRRVGLRDQETVERETQDDVRRRPGKAGVAPADRLQAPLGQRPADGAGKSRDQRDPGDRLARLVAVDTAERGEGGVVQAEPHADAEDQPRRPHHLDRVRHGQHDQSRGDDDVG